MQMVIGSMMILLEFSRVVFQTIVFGICLAPTECTPFDTINSKIEFQFLDT